MNAQMTNSINTLTGQGKSEKSNIRLNINGRIAKKYGKVITKSNFPSFEIKVYR
jgi:hypothetical protein